MIPFLFVLFVVVATVVLGIVATGKTKSAGDLFVAGRSVGVMLNAGAISGEYLSAASFMGIAGLVMKNGYDALWYPVGYAAGYLFLLLFIAGPLRRFGAYTIPDFAEGRFDSPGFRKIAVLFVLSIGLFYTMPQMKGAGVTMVSILGWPYWAGIVVVGTVITFNVALGGMKGITLVQAFQYWFKLFAISVPLFILAAILGAERVTPDFVRNDGRGGQPYLGSGTRVKMRGAAASPANAMVIGGWRTTVVFPAGGRIKVALVEKPPIGSPVRTGGKLAYLEAPSRAMAKLLRFGSDGYASVPAGWGLRFGNLNSASLSHFGVQPVKVEFADPTEVMLVETMLSSGSPGILAPNAPRKDKWQNPYGTLSGKHGYPLLWTYSLIVALVCGTAGLPHILVRFYTNPDGRAAKRTTLWVMVLLGAFYVFTPLWGTLGRAAMPALYASNTTDAVVIRLPTVLQNETLGLVLSGITAAGAFAAFMSTFSGLLVSMSGAFAHDVYGRMLRPGASDASRLRAFRFAAVGVGLLSMGLGLLVETFDIATMVGWAFAIGAASYFPLLLLGAWWRGLTAAGAATGMLLGGFASLGAIVLSMLLDKGVVTATFPPLVRALLEQPAIWGVPLSLTTMWAVSRATAGKIPADVDGKMIRLHAPEELGLGRNYIQDDAGGH